MVEALRHSIEGSGAKWRKVALRHLRHFPPYRGVERRTLPRGKSGAHH